MEALIDVSSNPIQEKFIFNPYPMSAYFGGVGNGKTTAGVMRGLVLSLGLPGNFGLVGRKTYPELRDTTQKEFLDIVRRLNGGTLDSGPIVKSYVKADHELEFKNGSKVIFRYLEEMEKILSLNLGWFYIDQSEDVNKDVWLTLLGRLRFWNNDKVMKFMANEDIKRQCKEFWGYVPKPAHYAFVTGNPHPGWVKSVFKESPPSDEYKLYEAPSDANKANLPPGFLENLRASYPKDWVDRYVDGSWDALSGQIYKEFNEAIHCIPNIKIPNSWPRIISLDHGYTNPTAVLWGAVDEFGNLIIYDEHYEAQRLISYHASVIKEKSEGQPVTTEDGRIKVWADPSTKGKQGITGKSVMEEYRTHQLALMPANNQVSAGILKVSELMKQDPEHLHFYTKNKMGPRLYIVRDKCPNLVQELKEYQWERRPPGSDKNEPEKPRKMKDHAVDALRYMVMTYLKNAPKITKVEKFIDPYERYMLNYIKKPVDTGVGVRSLRYGEWNGSNA